MKGIGFTIILIVNLVANSNLQYFGFAFVASPGASCVLSLFIHK